MEDITAAKAPPNESSDNTSSVEKTICARCLEFLGNDDTIVNQPETLVDNVHPSGSDTSSCCPVCLGLWNDGASQLEHAIHIACEPYGGVDQNCFSSEQPPTVVLPGDVALRYHVAATARRTTARPLSVYLQELKNHLKGVALSYVLEHQSQNKFNDYPKFVQSEEQGFLSVHILMTPSVTVQRPPGFAVTTNTKRTRKRFRGNDPTEKQGGDPRVNLEKRVQKETVRDMWSVSDVEAALAQRTESPIGTNEQWASWFSESGFVGTLAIHYHVAVWRRPFFVRALYTKSRRDVSQTPFYVPTGGSGGGKSMKRKGATSVEEQIVPVLIDKGCRGISTFNKNPDTNDIVYGMIKFHASGREDMNVRMLLPPEPSKSVGGRPFVCQAIDSLRMPTQLDLENVQHAINCTNAAIGDGSYDSGEDIRHRVYGRNEMGVGISDCFSFAPASSFKNLQAETEEKIKYYGCLCWSQAMIPSQENLVSRLGSYKLQLKQKTPLRVLHRRSNAVRIRHVLTLKPTRVDEHYFRLNISTDAGTYVKEFCHGDLGRTFPSVSTLLGCKTDILELDCEGIQQDV